MLAAQYQCDRHVVKMILESAQMLSTAQHKLCQTVSTELYKPTHVNHPSAVWVRQSRDHYNWLCQHWLMLMSEYSARYSKVHKCDSLKQHLCIPLPSSYFPQKGFTPPPQCMPEKYKQQDTVAAYRAYYIGEKSRFAKWNHGPTPDWYSAGLDNYWTATTLENAA